MPCLQTVAAIVVATFAWSAATAAAEPQVLATVNANVPISAAGGWVAWSALGQGGWRIAAWRGGVVTTLPPAPRPQPFDLDLGTDSSGRTVATFSRCTKTPELSQYGRTAAWTGAGCEVRVLDLATGVESASGIRRPSHASDTTPSMSRGRIAFARLDRRHRNVAQIKLWSPQTRRLETLRHGVIPSKCPFRSGCRGQLVRGAVEGSTSVAGL